MQAFSTFFKTLFKALTQPKYYADVMKAKTSFAVKYFVFLNFLVSLIVAGMFTVAVAAIPFQTFGAKISSALPNNLELELKDGKVKINQPLPYGIRMPGDDRQERPERSRYRDNEPKYLVIFESDKQVQTVDEALKYDTLVLVTETKVYAHQGRNQSELRVYPISADAENFSISSAKIQDGINRFFDMPFIKYKWYLVPVALIALFLVFGMGLLVRFVTVLVYAAIVWLLVKFFKKSVLHNRELSFGEMMKVSLLSFTWPMILGIVTSFWGFHFKVAGLWHFVAFLIWTVICLQQATTVTAPVASSRSAAAKPVAKPTSTTKPAKSSKKVTRKK